MSTGDLKKYILEQIKNKNWPIGYKIPIELELINQFKISKSSVRKILKELVDKNILFSLQGKGIYVSELVNINLQIPLHKLLKSEKVTFLPMSHVPTKSIYKNCPFNLEEINNENSFNFIKFYFLKKELQAYSINIIIDREKKINKKIRNYYINGELDYIKVSKDICKIYKKTNLEEITEFNKKLLRIESDYLPISHLYYLNKKNDIKIIRIIITLPKYFEDEKIILIKI